MNRIGSSCPCKPSSIQAVHEPLINCKQRLPVQCHSVTCPTCLSMAVGMSPQGFLHPFSMAIQAVIVPSCFGTATVMSSLLLA